MIVAGSSSAWPHRIQKRREPKATARNISRYFNSQPRQASATPSSPLEIHPSPSQSPGDQEYFNLLALQNRLADNSLFGQQDLNPDISWFPPTDSYTLPSHSSNPSIISDNAAFAAQRPPSGVSNTDFRFSPVAAVSDDFASDGDVVSMGESRVGSFDSIDSMALSLGDTVASSDSFIWPVGSPLDSADLMRGLFLPGPLISLKLSSHPQFRQFDARATSDLLDHQLSICVLSFDTILPIANFA
jgi:hypothetical protein